MTALASETLIDQKHTLQTWHPPQTDWCGFCCGETPSSAIVNLYTSGNMRLWKKMLYLWTDRQRSEHWAYILISASFGRKCNQWWKVTFWMFEFCIRVIPDWVQSVQLYSCTLGSWRKREVFNCSASNGQFWAWSSVQSKWQVTTPSTSLPYLWLLSFTGHKGLSLMSEICDCNKKPLKATMCGDQPLIDKPVFPGTHLWVRYISNTL